MFTGIVEEIGKIQSLEKRKNLYVLKVKAKKVLASTKIGDSIANDGVCLTVTRKQGSVLTFDMMKETLSSTTMGQLKKGSAVNLERSLKASSRLGGHFVTGHVDGMVSIKKIVKLPNYVEYVFNLPKTLKKFVVKKGSISIDGISLTVGQVTKTQFSVYFIPFTLVATSIGQKKVGQKVNVEVDILARYVLGKKA